MTGDGDDERAEPQAAEAGLTPLDRLDHQAAALAFLPDSDPLRFVLVTTRRTGRWSVPKGGIEDGMNGPATAVREAYEEAGVLGPAEPEPIGTFRSWKIRPPQFWRIEIQVFPLEIREIREKWPESDERHRRFVTLDEARTLLSEPAIIDIAARFIAGRK